MGSRVLARVCAKRMRWWAEHLNLMDENQWGFREGRSTADVTRVIVRMKEDANDYPKRMGRTGREAREENNRMVARLLDLEKAYPRMSKPALWMLLERYGLKGRFNIRDSDGTIPKFTSIPIPIKCSISILILDSNYNIF